MHTRQLSADCPLCSEPLLQSGVKHRESQNTNDSTAVKVCNTRHLQSGSRVTGWFDILRTAGKELCYASEIRMHEIQSLLESSYSVGLQAREPVLSCIME